jgi:hypothetical protein
VAGQAERGGLESLQTVAAFAAVRVGRSGELRGMRITMAIGATLKLDFVERAPALRNMTLRTGHGRMLPFQGISGCGVLFHAEGRRLEASHGVARGALTAAHPLGELATMRIGFVTIHTPLENQRLFEISVGMALHALDRGMFTEKRKFCFGVVEAFIQSGCRNPVPTHGTVAGLTGPLKAATVRIGVAIRALSERNSCVPRPSAAIWRVAFLACDLSVQSGERVTRFGMI